MELPWGDGREKHKGEEGEAGRCTCQRQAGARLAESLWPMTEGPAAFLASSFFSRLSLSILSLVSRSSVKLLLIAVQHPRH